HLREVQLASLYRVGRYTVRAALASLANEGLVIYETNRGSRVASLSTDGIRDLFKIRTVLEIEAARLATHKQSDFSLLEEVVRKLEHLPPDATWADVVRLDQEFHRLLVEAAQSERLLRAYMTVFAEVRLSLTSQRSLYRG